VAGGENCSDEGGDADKDVAAGAHREEKAALEEGQDCKPAEECGGELRPGDGHQAEGGEEHDQEDAGAGDERGQAGQEPGLADERERRPGDGGGCLEQRGEGAERDHVPGGAPGVAHQEQDQRLGDQGEADEERGDEHRHPVEEAADALGERVRSGAMAGFGGEGGPGEDSDRLGNDFGEGPGDAGSDAPEGDARRAEVEADDEVGARARGEANQRLQGDVGGEWQHRGGAREVGRERKGPSGGVAEAEGQDGRAGEPRPGQREDAVAGREEQEGDCDVSGLRRDQRLRRRLRPLSAQEHTLPDHRERERREGGGEDGDAAEDVGIEVGPAPERAGGGERDGGHGERADERQEGDCGGRIGVAEQHGLAPAGTNELAQELDGGEGQHEAAERSGFEEAAAEDQERHAGDLRDQAAGENPAALADGDGT
jgi:hypothetical protein